jgi:hypothetical protein
MSSSNNTPESELASIRQELNELRQTIGAMRGNGHYNGNGTSVLEAAESTALTDRRSMMKKMAGLAVGVAAVGLLKPTGAKAAQKYASPNITGGNMIIGAFNFPTAAGDRTVIENPGTVLFPVLFVGDNFNATNLVLPANSYTGLCGHVDNFGGTPTTGTFYGLYGHSNPAAGGSAIGVYGLAGTLAAPSGDGVSGVGTRGVTGIGSAGGCGCDGTSNGDPNSFGVQGQSDIGVGGTFFGGRSALFLFRVGGVANPNITNPAGGREGDLYRGSTNESLWYRAAAANGSYRRLADATTAGALTLLASAVRYIDTRFGIGDPGGAYTNGVTRQYNFVTLQAGTIPAGARGIVGNIVAVSPTNTGNIAISSISSFGTAVLNFNTNQDIGNHFVSAVDASGNMQVRVTVNGGGNIQLVIDIYGYYL